MADDKEVGIRYDLHIGLESEKVVDLSENRRKGRVGLYGGDNRETNKAVHGS